MTVFLYCNMTREHAPAVTNNVYNALKKLGVRVIMSHEVREYFPDYDVLLLPTQEATAQCDIMIAIGGDGTIMHAAHHSAKFDKPVLGINAGRLGFLAGLEKQELGLLGNLITGNYTIDKRMMLKVSHYDGDALLSESHCLNDCVVARGLSLRLCEIEVEADGKKVRDYLADGIIIATPTGSTAYSLSAGGPIVDTSIESLILTPVCSHSLFSRSMIFRRDTSITITVKNPEISLPVFSCDGEIGIELKQGNRVVIERSDRVTKLIKIKSDSFSDILSQKMIDRYTQERGAD